MHTQEASAPATLPAYVTVKQLAAETGLPAESIRVALRRHELPALRLGKGRGCGYYVRRDAAAAWLRQRETVPEAPHAPPR